MRSRMPMHTLGRVVVGASRHTLRIARDMACPLWRQCAARTLRIAMVPRRASPIANRATAWTMGDESISAVRTTPMFTVLAVTEACARLIPR